VCKKEFFDSVGSSESRPEGNQGDTQKLWGPRMKTAVERPISSAIDDCNANAVVVASQLQYGELARRDLVNQEMVAGHDPGLAIAPESAHPEVMGSA
jgi:hypothetical protein